jgi:hypothetical protein
MSETQRITLSLLFDLLEHPWWLLAIVAGLVLGGAFAARLNAGFARDRRMREAGAARTQALAEIAAATPRLVHSAARSIVHPDAFTASDRQMLQAISSGAQYVARDEAAQ